MYTCFNGGYMRTSPLWNQSVRYFTCCNVHSRENANRTDQAQPVEQSGVGALDVRVLQCNFEVVLEIWECVRSPKAVVVCFQQNYGNTILTIGRIRNNFETEGTVRDVHKQRSGRLLTSVSPVCSAVVLQRFTRVQKKKYIYINI
jgi:hypothetical protein